MNLAALQRDFRAWLVESDIDAARRIGDRAAAGLEIYRNNYRTQLVACLEDAFARVRAWLGDDAFLAAVVAHIDARPPCHWTLDAYPRGFPDTLAMLYPDDPEVAELGWLEHALAQAFVGADADPVSPESLALIDWDHAIIRLSPTMTIGAATTNAAAIWSALAAGDMPPPVRYLPDTAYLLVWRQDQLPCFRTIDALERRLLGEAASGKPFATLCALLAGELGADDAIGVAASMLGQWLSDGLVIGGDVGPEPIG